MPKTVTLSWKEYENLTARANSTEDTADLEARLKRAEKKLEHQGAALTHKQETYAKLFQTYTQMRGELFKASCDRDELSGAIRGLEARLEAVAPKLEAYEELLEHARTVASEAWRRTRPAGGVGVNWATVEQHMARKAEAELEQVEIDAAADK